MEKRTAWFLLVTCVATFIGLVVVGAPLFLVIFPGLGAGVAIKEIVR